MRSFRKRVGLFFALGVLLSAGCGALSSAAQEEGSVPLEILLKSSQCGAVAPAAGAIWIDRPQDLPPALGRSENYQWNAESEGALWIRMGAQPTGGFGLDLAKETAGVRRKVATIQINWHRPAPDQFVTQAFTSPCLVLKIPKAGIDSIRVVDQDGRLRAQVELP